MKGQKGEAGGTGLTGSKGMPGTVGRKGRKGRKGLKGRKGTQGVTGPPGRKGNPGAPGRDRCDGSTMCSLKFGKCYARSSSGLSVHCGQGYAAVSIWQNTRFWGLRCCEIIAVSHEDGHN